MKTKKAKTWGPDPTPSEIHAERQAWINDADTRSKQIERWCLQMNAMAVAVHFGGEPEAFSLPPGPPPIPPLMECYDAGRQQYHWPIRKDVA